jgi:hypothetical protein
VTGFFSRIWRKAPETLFRWSSCPERTSRSFACPVRTSRSFASRPDISVLIRPSDRLTSLKISFLTRPSERPTSLVTLVSTTYTAVVPAATRAATPTPAHVAAAPELALGAEDCETKGGPEAASARRT